jgi:cell division protein FtsI/penicillin-binding protein 2
VNDDPYDWAEIASGFNRDTTISPLHGAVMASAILNDGRMVAPSLVDCISDDKGKVLYLAQPSWEQQAMSAKASSELDQMMQTTIKSGTARKSFQGYQDDKILSQLQIGGKTGSMDNNTHEVRYDWFVGFANEIHGQGKVVVAVMVAHEKFIGIRAGQYARMAITHYFSKLLTKNTEENTVQSI